MMVKEGCFGRGCAGRGHNILGQSSVTITIRCRKEVTSPLGLEKCLQINNTELIILQLTHLIYHRRKTSIWTRVQ